MIKRSNGRIKKLYKRVSLMEKIACYGHVDISSILIHVISILTFSIDKSINNKYK